MSYWKVGDYKVDGSEANSTASTFKPVPHNTHAIAEIKDVTEKEYDGIKHLSIAWEIVEGAYTGNRIYQSIKVNSPEEAIKAKSKNMLLRIMLLCGMQPGDSEPTMSDFMGMHGNVFKVLVMLMNGKEKSFNYIKTVNKLEDSSAHLGRITISKDSGSREFDDGIPF